MKVGGIILAGGTGARFGSAIPKQFLKLQGKGILEYSIGKFKDAVDYMVLVANRDWMDETRKLIAGSSIEVAEGGLSRQLSVLSGLNRLSGKNIDIVVIHDGVRPLFSLSLLKKCIRHAADKGSAVPAVKVRGTLVLSDDAETISGYIDRNKAYELQTPQVFKFDLIYKAHMLAGDRGLTCFTDDSRLFEMQGMAADIIDGEEHNIKITTPFDLIMAEEYLRGINGNNYQK